MEAPTNSLTDVLKPFSTEAPTNRPPLSLTEAPTNRPMLALTDRPMLSLTDIPTNLPTPFLGKAPTDQGPNQ